MFKDNQNIKGLSIERHLSVFALVVDRDLLMDTLIIVHAGQLDVVHGQLDVVHAGQHNLVHVGQLNVVNAADHS